MPPVPTLGLRRVADVNCAGCGCPLHVYAEPGEKIHADAVLCHDCEIRLAQALARAESPRS